MSAIAVIFVALLLLFFVWVGLAHAAARRLQLPTASLPRAVSAVALVTLFLGLWIALGLWLRPHITNARTSAPIDYIYLALALVLMAWIYRRVYRATGRPKRTFLGLQAVPGPPRGRSLFRAAELRRGNECDSGPGDGADVGRESNRD